MSDAPPPEDVEEAEAEERETLLGRRALGRGLISTDELLDCLSLQVRLRNRFDRRIHIGQILYVRGHVTLAQVIELINTSTRRTGPPLEKRPVRTALLGEVLVEMGKASHAEVLQALDIQASERRSGLERPIGEILVGLGVITQDDLEEALEVSRKRQSES